MTRFGAVAVVACAMFSAFQWTTTSAQNSTDKVQTTSLFTDATRPEPPATTAAATAAVTVTDSSSSSSPSGVSSTATLQQQASSSSPSSSVSASTSSSTSPSSSALYPTTASSSVFLPSPSSIATTKGPVPSTGSDLMNSKNFDHFVDRADPTYARLVAAIAGGCGLLFLMLVTFVAISLILRYSVQIESRKLLTMSPRKSLVSGGGDGAFYSGQQPQSAQALVTSLSGVYIGGASDVNLDARGGGRGVYHNSGFDRSSAEGADVMAEGRRGPLASTSSSGSDNGHQHFEESYKPIEINVKRRTAEGVVVAGGKSDA